MTEQAPQSAISSMRVGGPLQPIRPQSLDDVIRISRMAVMSGLLQPPRKRWNDDNQDQQEENQDATIARGAMIILQGMDIGVPPMQALQLMAQINGRIVLHSEGVPAVLWANGFDIDQWIEGEGDSRIAWCEITRPNGKKIKRKFSVADAKKAKLWSPNEKVRRKGRNGWYDADNDSPWHLYEERMLPARALGFAVKDGASDVTRGLAIREEEEDIERHRQMIDVTPKEPEENRGPSTQAAEPDHDRRAHPGPQVDDIDDLPDLDVDADDTVHEADAPDERSLPPVNEPLFLETLAQERSWCESEEDLQVLCESNAATIRRLSPKGQAAATRILAGENAD